MKHPVKAVLILLGLSVTLTGCDGGRPAKDRRWVFEHEIADTEPAAAVRMNDIQIGDIDGDGRPDIWASGRGGGPEANQMVWYRNPDWQRFYIAPGDYKYGNLGDMDGDGDLDIVVSRSWLENDGSPAEGPWPEHDLGYDFEPDLVHLGDVNRDGRMDIVVVTKNEFRWLPGPENPGDPWTLIEVYADPSRRTGGALADMDGDGDPDLLWGNAWFENPGDGIPPWTMHSIDSQWPAEARGAVGDVDLDGRPDVVLSGEESSHGVAWYSSPPDPAEGQWSKNIITDSGYQGVHSLALADFDGDGDLDVFAAEMHKGKDPDKIAVFENADIESNVWIEHVIDDCGSHNAKVGDLDGDGRPDIVGKNYEAGAIPLRVDIWWNRVSPTLRVTLWRKHVIDHARDWEAMFIQGGDVNGDGRTDIIAGGWWYENPGSVRDTWLRHVIGGSLNNMGIVHDLDGDGDLDILGTKGKPKSNEFLWAENDGSGSFRFHENIPRAEGDFLQGIRASQIIPGGNVEVVLSWHNRTGTQMYTIPTPATEPWGWEVISPTTNGEQVAVADLDRDGDLDIHLGTSWLRNDGGDWTTVEALKLSVRGADPDRVELSDIDGDGDLDCVMGCEHAEYLVWAEAPDDPEGPWTEHSVSKDLQAMSMDVGDVDHDGDPDIVAGEHNRKDAYKGRVVLYRNDGRGASWTAHEIDTGLEHHDGTRLVDVDGDGDLDVISIGIMHPLVVLYENLAIQPRKSPEAR